MEENLCRDNHRNKPSYRELEVLARWTSFSGMILYIVFFLQYKLLLFTYLLVLMIHVLMRQV